MPACALRRLRKTAVIRDWASQSELRPQDLIMPYFVIEGESKREEIKSMPGVYHLSVDNLLKDILKAQNLGIKAVLLFGIPQAKDENGTQAYKRDGIVQKTIRAIKEEFPDLIVITDVCLCAYTTHGHCGIPKKITRYQIPDTRYEIDNEATLRILAKIARSHAEAGADFVAPSAMMDGQVRAIREALDKTRFLDKKTFPDTGILAYSAKYASNFYGPFREALDCRPQFGDRKTYQMDYRNSDEALREISQDIQEGADIVMVKPALAYLDVIFRVKQEFNVPIAAYNVSGEYSMLKAYCQMTENREQRTEIEKNLVLEILTSIKRAGANFIITYWAKEAAKWLRKF